MKVLFLAFGVLSYLIFFASFAYMVAFVGDFWVPKTVSKGSLFPADSALLLNLFLILIWGVQHSVMAREGFKKKLTGFFPESLERSLYVLISTLVLILLMLAWQPMPGIVWKIDSEIAVFIVWIVFFVGWGLVLLSTFLTSHADLFGLRQSYLYFSEKEYQPVPFTENSLYRWIRHPMMLGILLAFWATPEMSESHLVFATGMTFYVVIGVYFEERSLAERLGKPYQDYQKRTAKIIPWIY